jgi:hypothetical protein
LKAQASQDAFFLPLPEYLRPVFRRCLEILVEARLADHGECSSQDGAKQE